MVSEVPVSMIASVEKPMGRLSMKMLEIYTLQ